ncbi:MAG: hypothetical protein WDW38_007366 [Sanguina aurantia]
MTARNPAESAVKNQMFCRVTDEAKSLDNIATKRSALQAKAADVEASIRNLGSLPAEAFEKYKQTGVKELLRLLASTKAELSKFGKVNTSVMEQFTTITEETESFKRKQQELRAVAGK